MSSRAQDLAERSLTKLRQRLEVYSTALVDWQQAIDQATAEIADLSPSQADEAAGEINEVRKSHIELLELKEQVDAGWALYQKLSENAEISECINIAMPEYALPASLN